MCPWVNSPSFSLNFQRLSLSGKQAKGQLDFFIIILQRFQCVSSFVCYFEPRKQEHARVGISVGKKMGNAVVRNKIKRQVRSMVDVCFDFDEDFDTILIVRPRYHQQSFEENLNELKKNRKRMIKRKR